MNATGHSFCPSCGHNFDKERPLALGVWTLEPQEARHHGEAVRLRPQEAYLLYSVARAAGRWVRLETLGKRIAQSYRVAEYANLASVVLCKARKRAGLALPVESCRRRGVRWAGERA